MSTGITRWFHQWDKVHDYLVRCRYVRDGTPLSHRDTATWAQALVLQGLLVCDLSLQCSTNAAAVIQWVKYLASQDVLAVCRTFKVIDALLVQQYERDAFLSWYEFKAHIQQESALCNAMLSIFRRDLEQFLSQGGIGLFRGLHQAFAFLARINLVDFDDVSAIDAFVEADRDLRSPHDGYSFKLNTVMRRWLSGFRVKDFPQHGPGSTADAGRLSLIEKYRHIGKDGLLTYVLSKHGYSIDDFIIDGSLPWERTAKLQLVPKTALKKRTICMEPATLQFFQQMVRKSLYRFMGSSALIRRHIRLQDQTCNRDAARDGSVSGQLATIDLSAASDSVSWSLAKLAFKGTTLLPWLYATRSRRVEVPGYGAVTVKKYAPMGSALCFPIECLIFAGVCEVAKEELGVHGFESFFSVYGDDIVCHVAMVQRVIDILELLGFTVNKDKSFSYAHASCFRESCGGEYVNGVNVTPWRISRKFQATSDLVGRPDLILAYIDMANMAYGYGFVGCRRWFIRQLLKLPIHLRPIFGYYPGQVYTDCRTDYGCRERFNRSLFRREVLSGVITQKREPVDDREKLDRLTDSSEQCGVLSVGDVRYLHYWLTHLTTVSEEHRYGFQCSEQPAEEKTQVGPLERLSIKSRWRPVEVYESTQYLNGIVRGFDDPERGINDN